MAAGNDFFEGHSQIQEIRSGEFSNFISDKDVAMIMFYTPSGEACRFARDHFAAAPSLTDRPNAAYGAVNCSKHKDICFKEKAFELPEFRVYSRGMLLELYENIFSMTGESLAKYVENVPVPINTSTPAPRIRRY